MTALANSGRVAQTEITQLESLRFTLSCAHTHRKRERGSREKREERIRKSFLCHRSPSLFPSARAGSTDRVDFSHSLSWELVRQRSAYFPPTPERANFKLKVCRVPSCLLPGKSPPRLELTRGHFLSNTPLLSCVPSLPPGAPFSLSLILSFASNLPISPIRSAFAPCGDHK